MIINVLHGFYKTKYPIAIEPQEHEVRFILNRCKNWTYDEETKVFTHIREFPNGEARSDKTLNLSDYSFETCDFFIMLMKSPGRRSDNEWLLHVKPIHPNANIKTHNCVFVLNDEEAERLSKNPSEIPNILCKEFSLTDPFDQSISSIMTIVETSMLDRYAYSGAPIKFGEYDDVDLLRGPYF